MAKLILQLLVLACVTYLTVASVAIALPNPKYVRLGQCFDGKHAYNVGVHYPPNKCLQLTCYEDFTLDFETCGSVGVPRGYKNLPDPTKKYPECCENIVRIEDQENIIE